MLALIFPCEISCDGSTDYHFHVIFPYLPGTKMWGEGRGCGGRRGPLEMAPGGVCSVSFCDECHLLPNPSPFTVAPPYMSTAFCSF